MQRRLSSNIDSSQVGKFSSVEQWERRKKIIKPFIDGRVKFIHRFILDNFKVPLDSLSMLDVGCGVGFVTEEVAKFGGRIHGIDPGESLISYAKKKVDETLKGKLTYDIGTTEDELKKQGKESYDVIICSQVLEHVPNYKQIVIDIAKLLKVSLK